MSERVSFTSLLVKVEHHTCFNKSREHRSVSHKSRPAMQDMSPGVAPYPELKFPLSLGMEERLRRPILDHMLLKTLQACIEVIQFSKKKEVMFI